MLKLESVDVHCSELLASLSTETFMQAYEGVHNACSLEVYCRDNYSIDCIELLLSQLNVEAVVAFKENKPTGFFVLKHHDCPIELVGECTELKQIYVLSAYFGAGLGEHLFNDVIEKTLANKSKWLWLCVSDINYRAQSFYNKLGFVKIGVGPNLKVGEDVLSSSILALDAESKFA
ncbi:MAG: GNAT family N-acetyltransferase [Psychromonas sp.]